MSEEIKPKWMKPKKVTKYPNLQNAIKEQERFLHGIVLPKNENEILEELSKSHDMNKTAVVRKALRLFKLIDSHLRKGQKIAWRNPDGSYDDIELLLMGE